MSGYSFYEQETSITYNRADDFAVIYTANPADIRKLDRIREKRGNEMKLVRRDENSVTYHVPRKWIKIQPNVIISEERRKELSERFKLYLNNSKDSTWIKSQTI